MSKPTFLVIGEPKAGTSSLHYYLQQHPDVFVPTDIKELRYFSYDRENPYHLVAKSSRVKSYDEYLKYFDGSGNAKAVGEVSPSYLRSHIAPAKIADRIPNAKLIACLRNPADRLYSLYLMAVRNRSTNKSFDERVFGENAAWMKGNFYWLDLKRYYDTFGPHQLKIILFDDLKASTAETVADLYRYLGVDDTFVPDFSIQNPGGMPRNRALYSFLVFSKNIVKRIGKPPEELRHAWANIKSKSLQNQIMSSETRRKILEMCSDDIFRTQELIGRDLTHWIK